MATGDQANILARLRALLPQSWFPDDAPNLDGVLAGFSSVGAWAYAQIAYAKLQTRLGTATDGWLDLIAFDFFGRRIRRRKGQSDDSFRGLIRKEMLRERVTRPAIKAALEDLTGQPVTIFEPAHPGDTGGFNTGYLAYNETGRWGSLLLPYQMFIDVVQPIGAGIPNVGGYDSGWGGYNFAPMMLGDLADVIGEVTDQDIYDTVNATRAAGVTCWVAIGSPKPVGARLDIDFVLNESVLAGDIYSSASGQYTGTTAYSASSEQSSEGYIVDENGTFVVDEYGTYIVRD